MGKEREEIRNLMESLVAMADEVGVMLNMAIQAFSNPEPGAALKLREKDKRINRMENIHDAKCLRILALYQPEADDLRTVFMALKINNDLERIGDHAINVGERAESLAAPPPQAYKSRIERMGHLSLGMLSDALTAFVARDTALAKNVISRDDEADDLLRETIEEMLKPESVQCADMEMAISIVLAAKELERVADLCTNLAEDVVFMAEGETIKHQGKV
ncbi:MAG: phosphate signaling complex protein PhoU [Acidobacteria bacterium]|jgi:phosphate transport system protein|nr:phosphate signaling complex protein PhoU [Acidobacteriota bacterium]